MGYLNQLLSNDEAVLYEARPHIIQPLLQCINRVVVLGATLALHLAATPFIERAAAQLPDDVPPIPWRLVDQVLLIGVSLWAIAGCLLIYWRWYTKLYVVTSRRAIQLWGILNKTSLDSSLDKINDIQLRQSWVGRVFGYGTIEILTASEDGVNRLRMIADPLSFKRAMQDARMGQQRTLRDVTPPLRAHPAPPPPIDVSVTAATVEQRATEAAHRRASATQATERWALPLDLTAPARSHDAVAAEIVVADPPHHAQDSTALTPVLHSGWENAVIDAMLNQSAQAGQDPWLLFDQMIAMVQQGKITPIQHEQLKQALLRKLT